MITQLPQTPNVGPEVPQSLWNWLVELGKRIRALIDWVNNYTPPAGGDMKKEVYDTDDDGKVDAAVTADTVPWSGVTDPPAFASPGDIKISARKTPEPGWLKCNGETIGDALSGATARANDDTWGLFEVLWTDWSDADCPVFKSTGEVSTRGASAEADFAAHKRISLPNILGKFVRGWADDGEIDSGRAFGSTQMDAFQNVTGEMDCTYAAIARNVITGVFTGSTMAGGASTTCPGYSTSASMSKLVFNAANSPGARTADETRPVNITLSYFIKY